MKLLPRPIATPPTSEQRFGRKLAKLIATMRMLPEPPIKTQSQPTIANGMTAFGEWDSMRGSDADGAGWLDATDLPTSIPLKPKAKKQSCL